MLNKNWSDWRKSNFIFFSKKLGNRPASHKLIDLGAGELQFKDIFYNFDYLGIDFKKYPGVSLVADLTKSIPLPDGSADIVTLSNTLEHIPNPDNLIKECKRILRKGGIIVGTVPFLLGVHQEPYDFNRYTFYQLEKFLKDSGFSEISIEPLGSIIDTYNTIELKTFDQIRIIKGGFITEVIRLVRRIEMRLIKLVYAKLPASKKIPEGYGFYATVI